MTPAIPGPGPEPAPVARPDPAGDLVPLPAAEVAAAVHRAGRHNPLLGIDLLGIDLLGIDVAVEPAPDNGQPTHPTTAPAAGPAARLAGQESGPAAAAELVDAVARWLGITERRVAGSLVVLGYAARLVGPAVAVLLRDGILVDLRPPRVGYEFAPGRGFRLTLAGAAGWRGPPAALVERCAADLTDHLAGVLAAVRAAAPVAAGLLWGNVASGLAGALRSVARDGAAPAGRCRQVGETLLRYGPLAGSGQLTLAGGDLRFRRRSCCLYYRLDGGGVCGDCPLPATTVPLRRPAG